MPTKKTNPRLENTSLPVFKAVNQHGEEISNETLKGKFSILYFYPKDLTPGCTTESCAFRDNHAELKKLGFDIYGVSADPEDKHQKFIAKHDLNFDLIADTEKELIQALGLWVEKSMYGKKYMGISRETIIVNPEGQIIKHLQFYVVVISVTS